MPTTTTTTPANHQHTTREYFPEVIFCTRLATIDNDVHSIDAVLASESSVEVWDPRRGQVIDEILLISAAKLPQQMPLLDMHDRTLEKMIGSIRNIRREGGQIIGRLFFTTGDARSEKVWNIVKQGHITDVSVGYRVQSAIDIPAGRTQAVNGRSFTAKDRTLRVATEWTPKEGSLVPIGADPAAKTRESAAFECSNRQFSSTPFSNESEKAIMPPAIHVHDNFVSRDVLENALRIRCGMPAESEQLGNQAVRIADSLGMRSLCTEALRSIGHEVHRDDNVFENAIDSGAVGSIFNATVNSNFMFAFAEEGDSTAAFCFDSNVQNYKQNSRLLVQDSENLDRIPRGGTAKEAEFDFSAIESFKVAKFGKKLTIDEMDFDSDDLNCLVQTPALLGRAAAKLKPDLVFSLLLKNDPLSDELPLFHVDRGNVNEHGYLSADTIAYARGQMAGQVSADGSLRGARPDVLVTSESNAVPAAIVLKSFENVKGNVTMSIYADPRLDRGVLDPLSEENDPVFYPAEPMASYLFSSKNRAIECAYLFGKKVPKLRMVRLERGKWGYSWDISFSLGVKAINPYWMFKNVGQA